MHTSLPLKSMPVEFLNIRPLNPLISSCDVKVLYAGKNRNRSYISKTVGEAMANSLPNIPIVGEYIEYEKDFGDHAQEMVIDSSGVKFVKRTVPYGVVPADTKIAWQWFIDDDGVEREYLMCQGYLWTGRYPECQRVLEEGNGQSMELDQDSIQGTWAAIDNEPDEYFIIDEAIFSALCILGENVEPCFEGASVTAPSNILYSLDKSKFTAEMSQFMLDLKNALNGKEGGEVMENITGQNSEATVVTDANSNVNTDFAADTTCKTCGKPNCTEHAPVADNAMMDDNKNPMMDDKDKQANCTAAEDATSTDGNGEPTENHAKKPAEGSPAEEAGETSAEEATEEADEKAGKKPDDGDGKKTANHTANDPDNDGDENADADGDGDGEKTSNHAKEEEGGAGPGCAGSYNLADVVEYTELKAKYDALVTEYETVKPELFSLREDKAKTDKVAKENMISKFYMLDETDTKDVRENISDYTIDQIEAKLSVIAVRKKVNFNLDPNGNSENKTEAPIISYSAQTVDNTPAWLRAVDNVVKSKSN